MGMTVAGVARGAYPPAGQVRPGNGTMTAHAGIVLKNYPARFSRAT
jgi:hypothetical protein